MSPDTGFGDSSRGNIFADMLLLDFSSTLDREQPEFV